MDGILNINKPEGPSSFKIVSAVKRLTGIKKVGHAGTLDPAASGVLPICIGRATRVSEYLMHYPKKYRTEIEFGKTTDTYDREGEIISETATEGLTLQQIESNLPAFTGEIQQSPPAFSALKHEGQPYYKLARSGSDIRPKSRPVQVYDIRVIDWQPPVITIDITCGKGTYIRSIAHDLGQVTGYGAYMKSLIRLEYGVFSIDESLDPDKLEQVIAEGKLADYVFPIDSVLKHMNSLVVDENNFDNLRNGHPFTRESILTETGPELMVPGGKVDEIRRVYSAEGTFLGIFQFDPADEEYRPVKIFGN